MKNSPITYVAVFAAATALTVAFLRTRTTPSGVFASPLEGARKAARSLRSALSPLNADKPTESDLGSANPFRLIKTVPVDTVPTPKPSPAKPAPEIPQFRVSVIAGTPGQRFAIVNGKRVRPGDVVSGWTVDRIDDDVVVMRHGEQRVAVRLGK